MDNSIFLPRLLGPSMLVIGAGLLVNRATYRALSREFLDSPALIYLAGLIAFVAGLAIVLTHNVWEFGWPVIITIFGWASLFAGIFRIVFPAAVTRLGGRMTQSRRPANRRHRPLSRARRVAELCGLFRLTIFAGRREVRP